MEDTGYADFCNATDNNSGSVNGSIVNVIVSKLTSSIQYRLSDASAQSPQDCYQVSVSIIR